MCYTFMQFLKGYMDMDWSPCLHGATCNYGININIKHPLFESCILYRGIYAMLCEICYGASPMCICYFSHIYMACFYIMSWCVFKPHTYPDKAIIVPLHTQKFISSLFILQFNPTTHKCDFVLVLCTLIYFFIFLPG